jgi:hypothetical protein
MLDKDKIMQNMWEEITVYEYTYSTLYSILGINLYVYCVRPAWHFSESLQENITKCTLFFLIPKIFPMVEWNLL